MICPRTCNVLFAIMMLMSSDGFIKTAAAAAAASDSKCDRESHQNLDLKDLIFISTLSGDFIAGIVELCSNGVMKFHSNRWKDNKSGLQYK